MAIRNCFAEYEEKLVTVDVVCHGVPSPGVYRKYIKHLLSQYPEATNCTFRDKKEGWSVYYNFSLHTNNRHFIYRENGENGLYIKGFLRNIYDRKACSSCLFATKQRVGDITLADFWGIGEVCPEMNNKKGTSLVFL